MIEEPTYTVTTREINYDPTFDHIVKTIGIEMSQICNFHCDMCPAHSEKGRFLEERSVANDRLIDRVIPFLKNYHHKITRIDAGSVWGEPLMNARFFSNTERILEAYPEAVVNLTTNGSLLTPQNIKKLLSMKNLKHITVSVDAGTKQTYERIRKGGRWDYLMKNLSSLLENRKICNLDSPLISTNFVVMKNNFRELPKYVETMADIGIDIISTTNAHNCYSSDINQGIFDLPSKKSAVAKERKKIIEDVRSIELPENTTLHLPSFTPNKKSAECSLCAASTILIGIEGNVYPCCVIQSLSYEGKPEATSMGNIFEKDLESIWNSREFLGFRLKMLRGLVPNPICADCPFFYGM
jgi:radical SAM protein with 4Fe4S-binding SPASM domain